MTSPFRKTAVALVILAGLAAYAYFIDSKKPAKDEKPKEKVFSFERAKAKELRLLPATADPTRLVKEASGWRLLAPNAAPADGEAVDALLSALESLEIEAVVTDAPSTLADFGLEPPKLAVEWEIEGQKDPLKLLLGDSVPAGNGIYAKLPAAPRVFTLPAHLEGSFNKKPFDLRDRSVLHVKRDDVRSLEIGGPEGSYRLAKDDSGEWAFVAPLKTRAGRWSVDGLVGNLESLRMDEVAAEEAKDLKPFGLDKPVRTVSLGLGDGTSKRLEIGSSPKDKSYHARDAAGRLVVVIPGALVDDLAKGMKELRAKRLYEVATYEVEGFEVEVEGGKRACAKSTTKDKEGIDIPKWKKTAPEAKDLDTNKVQDALFAIGGVEAQEFVDSPKDLASYGLDKPALKVTLRFAAGKPAAWFEVGQKDGASYARRLGDDAILKLDAGKAEGLVKSFKEL
jgi:hypothetical protein